MRIARLTACNEEIDSQVTELKNLDIVGMVRQVGMTQDQLAALMEAPPANQVRCRYGLMEKKRNPSMSKKRLRLPTVLLVMALCCAAFAYLPRQRTGQPV